MKIVETPLPGLLVLEPRVHSDERGFFLETWNAEAFRDAGLDHTFVQDNHSRSAKGVLRGLHYQNPEPQGKLARVVAGAAFDVAVDLRRSSAHFGKWFGIELNADNQRMLWIPPGFAHGFLSLADDTDFLYKCTAFYRPAHEVALLWNDPAIGIAWPIDRAPILSAKDTVAPGLADTPAYP
ncbi:dTDP-4-dehydrorhamnose 3,5-epimerase [Sphingomonas sp. PAMC 26605]|uniref:dTDP-4-dehydrorhamnose 3,5-epimerase n=1 Tax=Sphingomonas sp. PAMC 26605 TaxID=1112214 RepID=UPI00026CA72A|nr:dTDP-4-dehydrorhamnose 3,5-epimerase [Sphingomonas sp. PAMC 26605]